MKYDEILKTYISTQGYKKNSPDVNNPVNVIPSNKITMENVLFPVLGISMETNEQKLMLPNQNYTFDNTDNVIEYPLKSPYMQDGGTAGMDGMIKARLALDSHFGNLTARRMTNYDTNSYEFPNGDKGNVYVSSYDNLVTPQIQDVNGKLQFIDQPWADSNANRSYEQSMKFEREEDARYFGENYKKYAPMMNLYKKQEGGSMNEEEQLQQMIQQIAQAIQQGTTPEQIVQSLVEQGLPQEQAVQLIQTAMQGKNLPQAKGGMTVEHNYLKNLNYADPIQFDFSKSKSATNLSDKIDYGMHSIGQGIHDYYADNTFGERVNKNAMLANSFGDPRSMTWALPNTGIGSGFKAITGLASGLAGSYLGYAKLFSKDKVSQSVNAIKDIPTAQTQANYLNTPEEQVLSNNIPVSQGAFSMIPGTENPYYNGTPTIQGTDQYFTNKGQSNINNINGYSNLLKKADPVEEQRKKEWFEQNPGKDWFDYLNDTNQINNEPAPYNPNPTVDLYQQGGLKQYQPGGPVFSDNNYGNSSYQGYGQPSIEEQLIPDYSGINFLNNNIQPNLPRTPWIQQYSQYPAGPRPPRDYPFANRPNKISPIDYANYYPGAVIDEGGTSMDNYQTRNAIPIGSNPQNPSNKTEEQIKKEQEYLVARGDDLGFQVANNALIGFQNFNDVLQAKDYEQQYNQMLVKTGNTDNRYNAINPINPYGTYTPNAGIGSNFGLVANTPIQDFGTDRFTAKMGGMKRKYQEGGEYTLSQEEIDFIIKNGGEIEYID